MLSYKRQKKQQQLYDDKVAGYRKEGNSQSEAEELAKQKGASTAETNYSGLQQIRYEAQKRKSSC